MTERTLMYEIEKLVEIIPGAEVSVLPSGLIIVIKGNEKVQIKPLAE